MIAVSEKHVILNETTSTPKIEYINDFLDVLPQVFEYFPDYKENTLVPIFSSLYIPENVEKYLTKHNIYAMGMKNDTMDLLNFEQVHTTTQA